MGGVGRFSESWDSVDRTRDGEERVMGIVGVCVCGGGNGLT